MSSLTSQLTRAGITKEQTTRPIQFRAGLAVAAAQLVLAMLIRSFAVPIFLGLVGGIMGMLLGSKGFSLLWPYCLMQQGMNANRSEDMLAGNAVPFLLACAGWLAVVFVIAGVVLEKRDVKA